LKPFQLEVKERTDAGVIDWIGLKLWAVKSKNNLRAGSQLGNFNLPRDESQMVEIT
jgi:hypothetical protein